MRKKQFKAESRKLLDMMINSIYTHKEIFLRELISNASDAIDKLYYQELTEKKTGLSREDFFIGIEINEEARELKIFDNGIGMSDGELEKNLGTIAKSGSLDFKKDNDSKDEIDIIGQFGVGFYSAFMVSDMVTVRSKKFGEKEAFEWISEGAQGYTIQECEKPEHGTEVILHIKDDTEEEKYGEYLQKYRVEAIVKKYSDYITYPIKMDFETQKPVEGKEGETETVIENRTLNSMIPIWRKNKSDLSKEDYINYYRERFYDFNEPTAHIHTRVEGQVSYDAILYIPSKAAFDYYTKEYEKGLALYTNGVLIMEKCSDLLPEYFSFVKGVVDSADLSLNISREMLQHDRQLRIIGKNIEKKIREELLNMLQKDREKYEKFFGEFGTQIKFGIYSEYGLNKEKLQDLVMYYSSFAEKMTTLKEYTLRMKSDQEKIYYACGENVEQISLLPHTQAVKAKGYEVLYMTDSIDEFAVQMMIQYDDRQFVNICSADFDMSSEEEKEKLKKDNEEAKGVLEKIKEALGEEVTDVRFTNTLNDYPVSLISDGGISIEMEKTLNGMPAGEKVKAQLILEINSEHPIAGKIKGFKEDEEKLKDYAKILYNMARITAGLTVDNPAGLTELVCKLL